MLKEIANFNFTKLENSRLEVDNCTEKPLHLKKLWKVSGFFNPHEKWRV